MPPSVRGSGSLIDFEASAFELILSDAATAVIARRAKATMMKIPCLFIIPPQGLEILFACTDVVNLLSAQHLNEASQTT
jgi:hypothetical protein